MLEDVSRQEGLVQNSDSQRREEGLSSKDRIPIPKFQHTVLEKLASQLKTKVSIEVNVYTCMLSHFSCVQFFATSGPQPSRLLCLQDFSRQGYWSELLYPPPGDLPNPGTEPESLKSPALAGGLFTTSATGNPLQIDRNMSNQIALIQNRHCAQARFFPVLISTWVLQNFQLRTQCILHSLSDGRSQILISYIKTIKTSLGFSVIFHLIFSSSFLECPII